MLSLLSCFKNRSITSSTVPDDTYHNYHPRVLKSSLAVSQALVLVRITRPTIQGTFWHISEPSHPATLAKTHGHPILQDNNMGQSLIDRIQAKLEVFRLEQRYTRRRNRRSTFQSNAIYVDGEYIYQTPNTTGSSAESSHIRVDALHGEMLSAKHSPITSFTSEVTTQHSSPVVATPERKRLNRFSSIPSFSSAFSSKERPRVVERRTSMIR